MSLKKVTYRQLVDVVPAVNCLLQGEGAFDWLDDIVQLRLARLSGEVSAQLRVLNGQTGRIRRDCQEMRDVPVKGEDGEIRKEKRALLPIDKRDEMNERIERLMDETVEIDVPEIRASQLRRPSENGGAPKIPSGWWEEAPGEEAKKRTVSPAGLLLALEAFIVMDLEES